VIGPSDLIILQEFESTETHYCTSSNSLDLVIKSMWIFPPEAPSSFTTVYGVLNSLYVISATRFHAGEYLCTLFTVDGRNTSIPLTMIVLCKSLQLSYTEGNPGLL
jgi:hypothetical protein